MQKRAFVLVVALLAVGVVGVVIAVSTPPGPSRDGDFTSFEQGGDEVKLGERSSAAPKAWVKQKPSNKLRLAQFRAPRAEGDKEDAEVALFHFPGGGSVDENLARWKDKFRTDKGKKVDDFKVDTLKVDGVDVTYLDIAGNYTFVKPAKENYRMIAVYFDSDDGPFFVTLIGPQATVAQHKKGFDAWLKGFKRG